MKSNQLLTEISRIQEMMGIVNENKMLLKESIGDEIAEILAKFLKKDITELTSLGVKNADDLKKLMDDFIDPLVPAANKVDLLKLIVDDLGEVALKSIAKNALDDATTGVGKVMNDRVNTYMDYYKQGIMTYDDVVAQVSDDLSSIMTKSSDELSLLKNAINDEALLKTKTQLDSIKGALDNEASQAAKIAKDEKLILDMQTSLSEKLESIKTQIQGLPSFKKLTTEEQESVLQFIELNKNKNTATLLTETETYLTKILSDPSRVKEIPISERKYLDFFLKNGKKILKGTGTILGLTLLGLFLTGNIGEAVGLLKDNWESIKSNWSGEGEETTTETTACNQTLENFKTYLTSQGFGQSTIDSATFDTNTCTGTVTLGDGSQESLKWNGTTFI